MSYDMKKILDAQIEKLYHRNWSKLEKSYKINRLKRYAKKKRKESKMSDIEYNQLLDVLIKAVKSKSLNSVSYIKYDIESAEIVDIPCLKKNKNDYILETKSKIKSYTSKTRKKSSPIQKLIKNHKKNNK